MGKIDRTVAVVCSKCNNEWMSDITDAFATRLREQVIDNRPASLSPEQLGVLVLFGFMKAVVVDHMSVGRTGSFFTPRQRTAFMRDGTIPADAQFWLATSYGKARGSGSVKSRYAQLNSSAATGLELFICSYSVGFVGIQIIGKRWIKKSMRRREKPRLRQADVWDKSSYEIKMPIMAAATWPLPQVLNEQAFDLFADRWKHIDGPRRRRKKL